MAEKFKFDYQAPSMKERAEIDNIRRQYLPKTEKEKKLERLIKLDKKVKEVPTIFSLSLGIVGTLVFGVGMCFFLQWVSLWALGIPFAIIGVVLIALAYPCYNKFSFSLKSKYSKEIIELSEELLNSETTN